MATVSADSICPVHSNPPKAHQRNVLLTDHDVRDVVERKLSSKDFHVLDWCLKRVGETSGFLGQYYNLSVTVRINDITTRLSFFAKSPPPAHSPQYNFLQRHDSFNKELVFYTDVMNRLGRGSGPKWLVDCYLCKRDTIIVLEDATLDGYVTPDKYEPFDEEHCTWMMGALARFHSRSLILNEKLRPSGQTVFNLYGHLLKEVLFADDDRGKRARLSSLKGACSIVDAVEGLTDNEKTVAKDRIREWSSDLMRLLEPSSKERNVICHRDVWPNNLMFKRDNDTGKVVGCYIIDFQFACYCPPAIDVMCSLYLTTDRATRDRCYESLIKTYHDELGQALADEGIDIEYCVPWKEFQISCAAARYVALTYAVMNLQVILLSAQATTDYFCGAADQLEQILYGDKRSDLVCHQYQTIVPYRTRFSEIIREIKDCLPDKPPKI